MTDFPKPAQGSGLPDTCLTVGVQVAMPVILPQQQAHAFPQAAAVQGGEHSAPL